MRSATSPGRCATGSACGAATGPSCRARMVPHRTSPAGRTLPWSRSRTRYRALAGRRPTIFCSMRCRCGGSCRRRRFPRAMTSSSARSANSTPPPAASDWQATRARMAEMVADQLRQYDADAVQYAEFMVTLLEGDERRQLAQAIGTETEPAAMLAALQKAGLAQSVAVRAQEVAELGQADRRPARLRQRAAQARMRRHLPLHRPGEPQQCPGGCLHPDGARRRAGAGGAQ